MKYLVVIFERMVNGETGELLSSSKREVGIFDSKQKAKKWIRKVVMSLAEKGAACDMFTYDVPSYVLDRVEEPPFEGSVTKVVIPCFYKKTSKLFQANQKVLW